MKRRMILLAALLALGTLVLVAGATNPSPIVTVKVECDPPLAAGTEVGVSIGGTNCNCPKSAAFGKAGSDGKAEVAFDMMGCHPTNDCIAYATVGGHDPCSGQERLVTSSKDQTVRIKMKPPSKPTEPGRQP